MQVVIDEILIGIANETLSLLAVEVHPDRSHKVCESLQFCVCVDLTLVRTPSLNDETHLITSHIMLSPKP